MNLSKHYALKAAHILMITSLLVGIGYFIFLINLKNEKTQEEKTQDEKKAFLEMNSGRVADKSESLADPVSGISERALAPETESAFEMERESVFEPKTEKGTSGKEAASPQETKGADDWQKDARRTDAAQTLVLKDYPKMEVVATGYYAGVESTGKTPDHPEYGITYSGVKVRRALYSTIAADPRVFPLGTILYIPGYGFGVVADTGSAIKGKKIDLYFENIEDVYKEWGKKLVEVYIIQKGKGKVTEEMLDKLNSNRVYVMNQSS